MASIHTIIVMVLYWLIVNLPFPHDSYAWFRVFALWLLVAVITAGLNGIVLYIYLALGRFIQKTDVDMDVLAAKQQEKPNTQ